MSNASILDRYMEPLLAGNRGACRNVVRDFASHADPLAAYHDLIWPAMETIDKLYRDDQINRAVEHMATRINRCVADQLQINLIPRDPNGRRILITCADGEPEELGAQMCADLFEAGGWDVYFVGGGIPNDEALSLVGQLRPDILLVFGTRPQGVPAVRALIDLIREVGANPTMNIMISGGVFNRAEGLWREVNADLFAKTAKEAIPIAESAQPRRPEIKPPGVPKKRRRRRRPALVAVGEA